MGTLLTVIVPVYQAADTLAVCVDSILKQSYRNFRLILVDDGSTDGSGKMADRLAELDKRIEVIHRTNGGLSAARNTGIEHTDTPYVTFIDSDDTIKADTFIENMRWIQDHPETDMLEYPIMIHNGSPDASLLTFTPQTIESDDVFRHWIEIEGYMHCYACNKIYRRILFEETKFPEGEFFEDAAIMPDIIKQCHNIRFSGHGLYYYNSTAGSITRTYSFRNQESLLRFNLRLLTEVHEKKWEVPAVKIWLVCCNLLTDLRRCYDIENGNLQDKVSELSNIDIPANLVLKSGMDMRRMIKALLYKILGVSAACRLFSMKPLDKDIR